MAKASTGRKSRDLRGGQALAENEVIWLTVGTAMHTVLAPALRAFVASSMKTWYEQKSSEWLKQNCKQHTKVDPKSDFLFCYENINGNKGRSLEEQDYGIKNHHDFAKLHLKPHMAKFTTLEDTSCGVSSLLTLMAESSLYNASQQESSKKVRDNILSRWEECHLNEWDLTKFSTSLSLMSLLAESLDFEGERTKEGVDALNNFTTRGMELCFKRETDVKAIKILKEYIKDLTASIPGYSKVVHQKLGDFKRIIDSQLTRQTVDLTDTEKAKGKNEITSTLLDVSQNCKEESNLSNSSVEGKPLDNPWENFEKIENIGHGKFATVVKVLDKRDGKEYALKQTHIPQTGKNITRCQREIDALSKLSHLHVVKYFDAFADQEHKIYIQIELCGNDLKACLKEGTIRAQIRLQTVKLFGQLLTGIAYIHREGFIHRDLKPANIFVKKITQEDLLAKIGDFGLACFVNDEMTSNTGAPLYRAPEQKENNYDKKVDIYTLGIVLFEVLKKEDEDDVVWKKHIKDLRNDLEKTLKKFEPYEPIGWMQIISNMLKINSNDRPAASDILETFKSILSGEMQLTITNSEKETEDQGKLLDDPWENFEKIENIGHGKFAVVDKVLDKRDGKEYALKQTHIPQIGKDITRCQREIDALSKLSHLHVVKYFDAFTDQGQKIYIKMELCGNDLKACLEIEMTRVQIRLHTVKLFEQLLTGIVYIHSKGLIHRDLKPSNIFVKEITQEDLLAKIGDFGLACFENDEMTSYTGTPLYQAPEQKRNNYDKKVDIYTFGIVLFEVLKKEDQDEGEDQDNDGWKTFVRELRSNTDKTLKEFEPYEPPGWQKIIRDMLQRNPRDRPAAGDILKTFKNTLSGEPDQGTTSHFELNPRKYQTELAAPGLQGKNSMICAPTGSGKTIVATMVIKRHVEKFQSDKRPFKVLFLANDIRLVIQQYNRLKDYLPNVLEIKYMSGNDTSEVTFSERFKKSDIMVVTPQIVLNSLRKKEEETKINVSQASLIVFDECHHTDKGHPYMEIMEYYLSIKIKSPDHPTMMLPQILGLTASIGVGTGKTCAGAINHVVKICSHLDAEMLMTVKENTDELKEYCDKPISHNLDVPKRSADGDIFVQTIKQLMKNIESVLIRQFRNVPSEYRDKLNSSPGKGTQSFTQWSRQLEEMGAELCNKIIVSCANTLYAYNESLQLYEDLRLRDAQNHLSQYFEKKRRGQDNPTDSWLDETFQEAMIRVKECIDQDGQLINPKLSALSNYLLKTYQKEQDSKVIMFTRTRVHTIALTEWLKENEDLKEFVKPGRLVGSHSSDDSGGITRSEQLAAIDKFKAGDLNVLVVTDAAREGIDVPDCNAVITYSHKTNVIGMVQKRGRARAKFSEYAVIGEESSGGRLREKINIIHESLMAQAINQIQDMQEMQREQYVSVVRKIQNDVVAKLTVKETQRAVSSNPPPDDMEVLCKECSTFVIPASSLRTVFGTNRTSIENFSPKYRAEPHPKPRSFFTEIDGKRQKTKERFRIFCLKCGLDWGVITNFAGYNLSVIKIRSFKCRMTDPATMKEKVLIFKQWKDYPYEVPQENVVNLPQVQL